MNSYVIDCWWRLTSDSELSNRATSRSIGLITNVFCPVLMSVRLNWISTMSPFRISFGLILWNLLIFEMIGFESRFDC